MNTVKVSKNDVATHIYSSTKPSEVVEGTNQIFIRGKVERFYLLGVSLSKLLGLNDCHNFIQQLRNLLEEYEVLVVLQANQIKHAL